MQKGYICRWQTAAACRRNGAIQPHRPGHDSVSLISQCPCRLPRACQTPSAWLVFARQLTSPVRGRSSVGVCVGVDARDDGTLKWSKLKLDERGAMPRPMHREHSITGSISPMPHSRRDRTHLESHLSVSGANRSNGLRCSGPSNDTRQFLTRNPQTPGKFKKNAHDQKQGSTAATTRHPLSLVCNACFIDAMQPWQMPRTHPPGPSTWLPEKVLTRAVDASHLLTPSRQGPGRLDMQKVTWGYLVVTPEPAHDARSHHVPPGSRAPGLSYSHLLPSHHILIVRFPFSSQPTGPASCRGSPSHHQQGRGDRRRGYIERKAPLVPSPIPPHPPHCWTTSSLTSSADIYQGYLQVDFSVIHGQPRC